MPIQFPDFQRISFDEANPFLTGMNKGQNMMQSFLQFPQDLQAKILANQIAKVQAQYAEPMAKAGLTKVQQENLWNPKIWQSEIGLRGAQAGKLGEETKWYGQEAASRIGLQGEQAKLAGSEAQQNLLKLKYLQQVLGGGGQAGTGSQMQSGTGGAQPQAGLGNAQAAPQGNSIYGIQTPTPTRDDIANKMLLGIDTFTPRLENAKLQQQDQYKKFQEETATSIQQANAAQKANGALAIFNKAMDKARYKGPAWGSVESSGWKTALLPGDFTNEQIADYAVANLLPGAIAEVREAMKTGQFSNLDMQQAGRMKASRTMTDAARETQTAWLNGVKNRLDEKAKFYTVLGNPENGAQKTQADMLWEQYQQEFPLINQEGDKYLGSNLGNWPLFTTPKAIASVQATGTYKPTKRERETFMMQLPNGQVVPIKKGKIESAFRKGAKPL